MIARMPAAMPSLKWCPLRSKSVKYKRQGVYLMHTRQYRQRIIPNVLSFVVVVIANDHKYKVEAVEKCHREEDED